MMQEILIVILRCNIIEYSKNYTKISGNLQQYQKDVPSNPITNSESFSFKVKITGSAPTDGNTKDVEITTLLKYFSNF